MPTAKIRWRIHHGEILALFVVHRSASPRRLSFGFEHLISFAAATALTSALPAQAGPLLRGGVGGPNSGAGVLPGAGFGQAGPGMVNPAPPAAAPAIVAPVAPVVRPAAGGVGGPASGAGVLPGAGVGRAGVGL